MGKKREYEVQIPIRETWIFRVFAENQKDAIARVCNGEGEQLCSVGGWPTIKRGSRYDTTEKTIAQKVEVDQ